MNKLTATTLAIFLGLTTTASADLIGTYMRKGDQPVTVHTEGGKLYCTRNSDGFELCHGMSEQADGTWYGEDMKHPDMPGFMTFNGTVTFMVDGMSLKGCAAGKSLCDKETWSN